MDLSEVRVNIDRVDKQIKELFKERMELADQVARVKAETGDTILKPDREIAIIEKLTGDVNQEIKREYIALLKRIMEVSRKYQYGRTLKLRNCLNIDWSSVEEKPERVAMIKPELYICDMVSKDSVAACDSFLQVAKLITDGSVDAGIGILEEIGVRVADDIHSVLTKEKLYINRCEVVNDSGIRKKVVLFSKKLIVLPDHNRLKMMFVCKNKSGALASILSMISDYGVNLTEIHSRPNHESEWNYEFYVEFEANLLSEEIQALVFQLGNETQYFQLLGSYSCEGDF